jgi:L-methionine (R)-S-oxide reductase
MLAVMDPKIADTKDAIERLARDASSAEQFMRQTVELLRQRMLAYHWVGFYMLDADTQPPTLVLGPFAGATTPHTRIPLNQGICGAAASSGETVVVDDVRKDNRYLACSLETKSEIVVPIAINGRVVGELDIDSHFPAAFAEDDRQLLEYCASLAAEQLTKKQR